METTYNHQQVDRLKKKPCVYMCNVIGIVSTKREILTLNIEEKDPEMK